MLGNLVCASLLLTNSFLNNIYICYPIFFLYGVFDNANQIITNSILGNIYHAKVEPFTCLNITEAFGICITSILSLSKSEYPLIITHMTLSFLVIIYLFLYKMKGLK